MCASTYGIESFGGGEYLIIDRGMDIVDGFMSGGGSSAGEQFGGLISNFLPGVGAPEESIPRRGGEGDADALAQVPCDTRRLASAFGPSVL